MVIFSCKFGNSLNVSKTEILSENDEVYFFSVVQTNMHGAICKNTQVQETHSEKFTAFSFKTYFFKYKEKAIFELPGPDLHLN